MNTLMSSTLAITSMSIPPMELIEKNMVDPKSLMTDQYLQVIGFSAALTVLHDYATADDKVGIDYVSKYYSYFCEHYSGYSALPEAAKPSFQVANFSDPDSFMGQAYIHSSCAQNYFDL